MIHEMIDNKKLFRLIQWTWGFPQTMLGAALYLHYRNEAHEDYHSAAVTFWPHDSSVSLGMFLFVSKNATDKITRQMLLTHEYGHAIQSLMSGPLYLGAVGLPSFLWNRLPTFERARNKKKLSYYAVYPEKQANMLGERYLRKRSDITSFS